MRYFALACDYDGTIATDGVVTGKTIILLEQLRHSGRKIILVTGRELDDLQKIFPQTSIFDLIVAENGALLYHPTTHREILLGEKPPENFIQVLTNHGIPLSVGRVIVATWQPYEKIVLDAIRDSGLELQVIFNKGAVMVLPAGINKASGLQAALTELGLSPHNAVGVGDAENDHAFLNLCECAVAVANALPALKDRADWVTEGDHGAGVEELINTLLESDLEELGSRLSRYDIQLGNLSDDRELSIQPYRTNLLIAGTSQGGKTTLATGIIERLIEKQYQLCILDPEGDYSELEGTTTLGSKDRPPQIDEIFSLLEKPEQNLVVNLLGVALEQRPEFFAELYPRLQELRTRTGRPHWIVIDETHHLLPSSWNPASLTIPQETFGTLMITVEPHHVSSAALSIIDSLIVIGEEPKNTFGIFCEAVGETLPEVPVVTLEKGTGLFWKRGVQNIPQWFRSLPPAGTRRRHHRKYAQGELPEWARFYFKGREGKLNLEADNLMMFLHLAEGVDDDTWLYHLHQGDYSTWFRKDIRDEELAAETEAIEQQVLLSAQDSRALIRQAIEKRYTVPA